MALSDEQHWNRFCELWNSWIISAPWAMDMHHSMTEALTESGCFYRFSPERFKARSQKASAALVPRPIRLVRSQTSNEIIEVPIVTALRPAFLPRPIKSRLFELGTHLESILTLSGLYLRHYPEVFQFFGDPKKGEFFAANWKSNLSPMQWARVDFLWRWEEQEPSIKFVDINLLPGMTFVNEVLARIFTEQLAGKEPPDSVPILCDFETGRLSENMIDYFSKCTGKASQDLNLAILAREFHGLGADSELCANRLSEKISHIVKTTTPVALSAQCKKKQTMAIGPYDGLVRMARPISKHTHPINGRTEDAAFEYLVAHHLEGQPVFPPFNAFLENHSWFSLWQTDNFAEFAHRYGSATALQQLRSALPITNIIEPNGRLFSTNEVVNLTPSALKGRVLKLGNSTGGQGLAILKHASSGQITKAFHQVKESLSSGWLLQELVDNQKETFPVSADGNTVSLVNGYMTYAAYFSGNNLLGCHALMTPSSRKVHGGFKTLLIPSVFI